MESVKKQEFILEGLDCANCAAKIEKGISELHGVTSCSVNFAAKTMQMEIQPEQNAEILGSAKKLVKKLEPHVEMKEKGKERSRKQIFIMQGLTCANCAAKIEKQAAALPGITSSTLDFVSKRLILEGGSGLNQTFTEVTDIVRKLEPDVKVLMEQKGKDKNQEDHSEKKKTRALFIRIFSSALLMAAGLAVSLPAPVDFLLFLAAYVIIGGDVLLKAVRNIAGGQVFDENFLMALATAGAFSIGQFPEGVSVMLFYQIGEFFQGLAVNRSRRSIQSLMDIRPDFASLKTADGIIKVSPEDVAINDYILVKPGEKIPLDGIVAEGSALVDTSALTGESVPRKLEAGSDALSGFINKDGVITVKVTRTFEDSAVTKILDLVQNASSKKAPTENFITKFARYYTPAVVCAAFALAVIPPLFIGVSSFPEWIYRALVFLVISCPCALVVSIPLGFFGGVGGASRKGILVKGSNYLEALNHVKYVVFDKTGTLTKGIFEVVNISPVGSFTKEELLEYAAYAEAYSNHPIALSIKNAYGQKLDEGIIKDFKEISGHGISVMVNGKEILAGNKKLMDRNGVIIEASNQFGTIFYLTADGIYAGYIVISDHVKEDAKDAVRSLKQLGIKKTVMLTGDATSAGEAVAQDLGIDEVYAELLPHEKVEEIEKILSEKASNEKLIFVGDGINDTPVLARADIGIAMGGLGSDAAIEAADVVIMTDEPSKITTAIKLAKRTHRIIWQNIIFALGVKAVFLVFGAFGFATMWEAVFSDVGVTVLAVLNSMRALKVRNI